MSTWTSRISSAFAWLYVRGETLDDPALTARFGDGGVTVYENYRAFPRAFIAHDIAVVADRAAIVAAVGSASSTTFGTSSSSRQRTRDPWPDRLLHSARTPTWPRRDRRRRSDRHSCEDVLPGLLVLADAYTPIGVAEVDGSPTPVLPVMAHSAASPCRLGTRRHVHVPAGRHLSRHRAGTGRGRRWSGGWCWGGAVTTRRPDPLLFQDRAAERPGPDAVPEPGRIGAIVEDVAQVAAAARAGASVRVMNIEQSFSVATAAGSEGSKKLGQPVRRSNLASGSEQLGAAPGAPMMPGRCSTRGTPVNARSVPLLTEDSILLRGEFGTPCIRRRTYWQVVRCGSCPVSLTGEGVPLADVETMTNCDQALTFVPDPEGPRRCDRFALQPRQRHRRDWRRLADFYVRVFGCTLVPPGAGLSRPGSVGRDRRSERRAPWGAPAPAGTQSRRTDTPDPTGTTHRSTRGRRRPTTPGSGHIAFAVPDVPAARESSSPRVAVSSGDRDASNGSGRLADRVTWTYVADPEGNIVELQSWSDD